MNNPFFYCVCYIKNQLLGVEELIINNKTRASMKKAGTKYELRKLLLYISSISPCDRPYRIVLYREMG